MNASIVLDQPGNVSFTNLDEISGKVVLRTTKDVTIDTIVVKLEGESRTRLLSPPSARKSDTGPKPQLEYHKVCEPFSIYVLVAFNANGCLLGSTKPYKRNSMSSKH